MKSAQSQGTNIKDNNPADYYLTTANLKNLNMNNSDYNCDDKRWTSAMVNGELHEMQRILQSRPDFVHIHAPCTGYTALHLAVQLDREDIINYLIQNYDANVNARCRGGFTPLHLAVKLNRISIFGLLYSVYRADVNIMDWYGKRPLDYCNKFSPDKFLNFTYETCTNEMNKNNENLQDNDIEIVMQSPAVKHSDSAERSWYSMDHLELMNEDCVPLPPPNTPRLTNEVQQLNLGDISDAVITTLKNLQEKPDKRALKKSASMDNLHDIYQNNLPIQALF